VSSWRASMVTMAPLPLWDFGAGHQGDRQAQQIKAVAGQVGHVVAAVDTPELVEMV